MEIEKYLPGSFIQASEIHLILKKYKLYKLP